MLIDTQPNIGRLWIFDAMAGLALLAGATTPWLRSGQGHTLSGLDLADQLLGGAIVPSWGRTVGVGLYACVGVGALLLASVAFRSSRLDRLRFVVSAAMLALAVLLVMFSWFPLEIWGPAPFLAVLGLGLSCGANAWSVFRGNVAGDSTGRE